jgi:hypothetical protein
MPTVGVFNKEGNKVSDMELNDSIFAVEVNEYALHQVVVALLALISTSFSMIVGLNLTSLRSTTF